MFCIFLLFSSVLSSFLKQRAQKLALAPAERLLLALSPLLKMDPRRLLCHRFHVVSVFFCVCSGSSCSQRLPINSLTAFLFLAGVEDRHQSDGENRSRAEPDPSPRERHRIASSRVFSEALSNLVSNVLSDWDSIPAASLCLKVE